jgi:hypothetical protein
MPKDKTAVGQHFRHFERVVLDVDKVVGCVNQAEVYGIGVWSGIKSHGVAEELPIS